MFGLLALVASVIVPNVFAAVPASSLDDTQRKELLSQWCSRVRAEAVSLNWQIDPCEGLNWTVLDVSAKGNALVYSEFGDPKAPNTTLVFTMVHGDEVTPLFVGIELARWMKENQKSLPNTRVVIAPLVNPDSFFFRPRTRVNANGVDVNRNFPTKDWKSRAIQAWKSRFRSEPRRFPGNEPSSEPETVFQMEMIRLARPQKILSVHAPLNFLDYDGPTALSLARFPKEYVSECLRLRKQLRAISGGFFPGSLGNYAGQERGIPTLTLELPTADPRKAEKYWDYFRKGIRTMIEYKVPDYANRSDLPTGG